MTDEQPLEQNTATETTEPGTTIVLRRYIACPYLGLKHDPTVTALVPTAAHVCYARKRRYSPSDEHQSHFCFSPIYPDCSRYPDEVPDSVELLYPLSEPSLFTRSINWMRWIGAALAVLVLAALGYLFLSGFIEVNVAGIRPPASLRSNGIAGTNLVNAAAQSSPGDSSPASSIASDESLSAMETPVPAALREGAANEAGPLTSLYTETPIPVAEEISLTPNRTDVGWWVSAADRQTYVGDSFLYVGTMDGEVFMSAIRYDLRRIARGAPILSANIRLTGSRSILTDQTDTTKSASSPGSSYLVQLIAEKDLPELAGNRFADIANAPASITLSPQLTESKVAPNFVNEWSLDQQARDWLYQQMIDGAESITVRIIPYGEGEDVVFAWDSGQGSESAGAYPELALALGPKPPTPPPTPTRPLLVATFTPLPENVLTVVARSASSTASALNPATATSAGVYVVTPTPTPENLATLQAAVVAEGLPAVVLHTPVPQNAATEQAVAEYATAVALTTGTFTPVPTNYVTPVIVLPSPPPENVATAAARAILATEAAQSDTIPATLPWNAVTAVYEFATATPGNRETAVAVLEERNQAAISTGTPTPTPFNLVIITRVPEPTATRIPLIVDALHITPTPTPTPTFVLTRQDLESFSGKILFLSDRSGEESVWAMDPATGEVIAMVTDSRIHEQARELFLPNSPNGKERVYVVGKEGNNGTVYDLYVEDKEYGTTRKITDFKNAANYDPAWSPVDDRIAFVSTVSDGDEIYVTHAQGGDPVRLTYNQWEWDKHPTWSPDGSKIAFFSNRITGQRQIWIMNADGSDQRNLSNNEFNDWDPVWIR